MDRGLRVGNDDVVDLGGAVTTLIPEHLVSTLSLSAERLRDAGLVKRWGACGLTMWIGPYGYRRG